MTGGSLELENLGPRGKPRPLVDGREGGDGVGRIEKLCRGTVFTNTCDKKAIIVHPPVIP